MEEIEFDSLAPDHLDVNDAEEEEDTSSRSKSTTPHAISERCSLVIVAIVLFSILVGFLVGLIVGMNTSTSNDAQDLGLFIPWAPLPSKATTLRRISFGSCADQKLPHPFWDVLWGLQPDLTILGGDNVYGDCQVRANL